MNYHEMLVVSVKFRLQVILSVNLKPITISTADKHARPSHRTFCASCHVNYKNKRKFKSKASCTRFRVENERGWPTDAALDTFAAALNAQMACSFVVRANQMGFPLKTCCFAFWPKHATTCCQCVSCGLFKSHLNSNWLGFSSGNFHFVMPRIDANKTVRIWQRSVINLA